MHKPRAFFIVCAGVLCLAVLRPRPAAAAWPTDPLVNVPLCSATNIQWSPKIVSDGEGGAIVAWTDLRGSTTFDIYAQHVLASGAVDPAWPADGRALCTAANDQNSPTIVSDGSGGAIVAWTDSRGSTTFDIYAQHVLASGAVNPAWPADGRALCTAANDQNGPTIVSDGSGGAIVAWHDSRSSLDPDIYAQRVLASGVVDPAWPPDGRALCTAAENQWSPTIVSDGTGGAIVTWYDWRSGNYDIYAQHVLASGAVDPAWPANGRALCTAATDQTGPAIVSDGSGGAIVAWQHYRYSTSWDIYAQHVLASGAVDPAWPANGRALCTAADFQEDPRIASDRAGGAIVTWQDCRSGGDVDIYAQHVLASGAVDPAWPADGRALCTATSIQRFPGIVSDGAGGAIVTWEDLRSGSPASGNYDIHAQRVLASGAVDPAWPADGRALCTAANDQLSPAIVLDGSGGAIVTWQDSRGTSPDIYAQRVDQHGNLGSADVPVDAPLSIALHPVRPNPSRGGVLTVHFALASPAAASLELFDVAGRRIAAREVGSFGTGRHALDLGEGARLAPGLYLVRLTQGANVRVTRAAVLR